MNVNEIRILINESDDYKFLYDNPHLGSNIILLGLGGSYAYGTNLETSDIDIRGVALNSKEDLLTNSNFDQVCEDKTDTTIYSFNKIISLLSNCNPNVIEMLGLKDEHYLYMSPIGQELLNNKNLFLSKKCIQTFGGYANQQLYRLKQLCTHSMPQRDLEMHILKSIQNMSAAGEFADKYNLSKSNFINLFIDKSDKETMDTEIFMDVKMYHYPLRDYCGLWNELQNVAKSYNKLGKRNSHAVEHGKIAKHMMHLIRLYLMCNDIMEYGEIITYREKEHDLLMEIRNGKYVTDDNNVLPEFYDILEELENKFNILKVETKLPNKPNYKEINNFMMNVNERIIKGEI